MRELEPIKPTLDLPMSVATEELTGFEIEAIEKHYNAKLESLGVIKLMVGTVWAFESRAANKPAGWAAINAMTMRQLAGYFEPEPEDIDPDNPDSDTGKGFSPDA